MVGIKQLIFYSVHTRTHIRCIIFVCKHFLSIRDELLTVVLQTGFLYQLLWLSLHTYFYRLCRNEYSRLLDLCRICRMKFSYLFIYYRVGRLFLISIIFLEITKIASNHDYHLLIHISRHMFPYMYPSKIGKVSVRSHFLLYGFTIVTNRPTTLIPTHQRNSVRGFKDVTWS